MRPTLEATYCPIFRFVMDTKSQSWIHMCIVDEFKLISNVTKVLRQASSPFGMVALDRQ